MDRLEIRKADEGDFERILEIYALARQFMVDHGNPRQWALNNWPPEELLKKDIELGRLYVTQYKGYVEGVFLFDCGKDVEPTYRQIEGAFSKDDEYGVIHRIASSGAVKGVARTAVAWALENCPYLRMDTHPDNKVMQNMFDSLGFRYCGIIHVVEDNDPRFAYDISR